MPRFLRPNPLNYWLNYNSQNHMGVYLIQEVTAASVQRVKATHPTRSCEEPKIFPNRYVFRKPPSRVHWIYTVHAAGYLTIYLRSFPAVEFDPTLLPSDKDLQGSHGESDATALAGKRLDENGLSLG